MKYYFYLCSRLITKLNLLGMTYQEFLKAIPYMTGDSTAFVLDEPNNRYNYSLAEVYNVLDNAPSDGYRIEPIKDYPLVLDAIRDNFLYDIKPAEGVSDDAYDSIKAQLDKCDARLGIWENDGVTTYMLILD